jgi:cyclopropane-fatty-acyl-phospholipid synthase
MFDFYSSSCELGFRSGCLAVFQIQMAREQTAVPLIRDYIARPEHRDAEAGLLRATGR